MTPEERDYQEAIRRIQEAEENKSIELGLSNLESLTRFPPELAGLTSLQSLNLARCHRLSGDLRPLAELASLQSLDLSGCTGIRQFAPLEPLLARLEALYLYDCRFDDLPPEICRRLNLSQPPVVLPDAKRVFWHKC